MSIILSFLSKLIRINIFDFNSIILIIIYKILLMFIKETYKK